jgi:hypothetical protein
MTLEVKQQSINQSINQSMNQSIDFYVVSRLRRNTLVRKDRDVFEHDRLSNLRL